MDKTEQNHHPQGCVKITIQHQVEKIRDIGVQVCLRCGKIITDYRNALTLGGRNHPLSGFSPGSVYITGNVTSTKPPFDKYEPCKEREHSPFCEGHVLCPTCDRETCAKEVVHAIEGDDKEIPVVVVCLACNASISLLPEAVAH